MGFYAPAQIVRDAREHGVAVLPVDINHSCWDLTLEKGPRQSALDRRHAGMEKDILSTHAVRLGFRQIKGFSEDDARRIESARGAGFDSVRDLRLRARLGFRPLELLANADAFGSLGLNRRDASWAVEGLDRVRGEEEPDLFTRHADIQREEEVALPAMPPGEEVAYDYKTLKLLLKRHPVAFLRRELDRGGYVRNETLREMRSGDRASVSGLVLVRQRPGTARGVIFAMLEDETSIANIIIWPKVFERFRRELLGARFLGVDGKLQREGEVIHVVAWRLVNLTPKLALLSEYHDEMDDGLFRTDEFKRPIDEDLRARGKARRGDAERRMDAILPGGRNFH